MIPAVQYQVGGTLVFDVPEPGTISDAHIAIIDPHGTELRAEITATFSDADRTLSTAISPTEAGTLFAPHGLQFDILGRRPPVEGAVAYQARWRYTIGGVESRKLQLFEVRRFVVTCPVNETKLFAYDYLPASRKRPDQDDYSAQIKIAWERDVCDTIRARGRNPHLVRDVDQLELSTVLYSLSRIYAAWGGQYREQAASYAEQGGAALEQVFTHLTWYDYNEDGTPTYGEVGRPVASIRMTR